MIERILGLIAKKGITAHKLAGDLGLASGTISQWKQGLQRPSTDAVIKIAQYFGVSTDYLLMGNKRNDEKINMRFLSDNGKWYITKALRNCLHDCRQSAEDLKEYARKSRIPDERMEVFAKIAAVDSKAAVCSNFLDEDFPLYIELATMARISGVDDSEFKHVKSALEELQKEQKIIELHERASGQPDVKPSYTKKRAVNE